VGEAASGAAIVCRDVDAGRYGVGTDKPVADDRGEPGVKDLFGNEPVGIGDIGNFEVGDQGKVFFFQFPD
jgi:hypothetical protein